MLEVVNSSTAEMWWASGSCQRTNLSHPAVCNPWSPDCSVEEKGVGCCGKNKLSTFKNNWLKPVIKIGDVVQFLPSILPDFDL